MTIKQLVLFLLAILSSLSCFASGGPPPVLQPTTYYSQSKQYSLHVAPSDRLGCSSATYTFKQDGKPVWTKTFPFSLWQAVIANTGHVAGYAYTHGYMGHSTTTTEEGYGDFIVALISPKGLTLNKEITPRKWSPFSATPPSPTARGIFLNDLDSQFTIRIADADINRGIEKWQTYGLSKGKMIRSLEPRKLLKSKNEMFIKTAKAIPNTPLTLIHWWRWDHPAKGAIYTLIDSDGNQIWDLKLYDDYTNSDHYVQEYINKYGGILSVGKREFELLGVKEKSRLSYIVRKTLFNRWMVVKSLRTKPFELSKKKTQPMLPKLTLTKLTETTLGSEQTSKEISVPCITAVGWDSRVYISDNITKQLHIFDSSGTEINKFHPYPNGIQNKSGWYTFSMDMNQDIFTYDGSKTLHFDNQFHSTGSIPLDKNEVFNGTRRFQPHANLCWMCDNDTIYLVKDLNSIIKTITHRPDGPWIQYLHRITVTSEGALLIASSNVLMGECFVSLFSPDGTPVITLEDTFDAFVTALAGNDKHIFIRIKQKMYIYTMKGLPQGVTDLPEEFNSSNWRGPFVAKNGSEIWFISTIDMKIRRYETPAE